MNGPIAVRARTLTCLWEREAGDEGEGSAECVAGGRQATRTRGSKPLGSTERFRSKLWGTATVSHTGEVQRVERGGREEKQENVVSRSPVRSDQLDQ